MKNYDELALNSWPSLQSLIIGGPGSGKSNVLLNFIKNWRPDINKVYFPVKFPFQLKYQLLINGREKKLN